MVAETRSAGSFLFTGVNILAFPQHPIIDYFRWFSPYLWISSGSFPCRISARPHSPVACAGTPQCGVQFISECGPDWAQGVVAPYILAD